GVYPGPIRTRRITLVRIEIKACRDAAALELGKIPGHVPTPGPQSYCSHPYHLGLSNLFCSRKLCIWFFLFPGGPEWLGALVPATNLLSVRRCETIVRRTFILLRPMERARKTIGTSVTL